MNTSCFNSIFVSLCCDRYELNWMGCLLVVLHDFLDHVDGIVAKVHRRIYGNVDDPLLGGFMDAFCDKVKLVLILDTIILTTGTKNDLNLCSLFFRTKRF